MKRRFEFKVEVEAEGDEIYDSEINRLLEEVEDKIKSFAKEQQKEYIIYDNAVVVVRIHT